jgi:hypothetical protein
MQKPRQRIWRIINWSTLSSRSTTHTGSWVITWRVSALKGMNMSIHLMMISSEVQDLMPRSYNGFKPCHPRRGHIFSKFRNIDGAVFPQSYRVRTRRLHMYNKQKPMAPNIQDLTKRNTRKRRSKPRARNRKVRSPTLQESQPRLLPQGNHASRSTTPSFMLLPYSPQKGSQMQDGFLVKR